jgi:hypothetical protein
METSICVGEKFFDGGSAALVHGLQSAHADLQACFLRHDAISVTGQSIYQYALELNATASQQIDAYQTPEGQFR